MMLPPHSFMMKGHTEKRRVGAPVRTQNRFRALTSQPPKAEAGSVSASAPSGGDSVEIQKPTPVFHREFDTQQDAALFTPRGQWHAIGDVLREALSQPQGQIPQQVRIKILYPDAPPLDKLQTKLKEMDEFSKTNGIRMMIARRRGFPSQAPRMQFDHDARSIYYSVKITESEIPHLQKFADFLIKNYQYLDAHY